MRMRALYFAIFLLSSLNVFADSKLISVHAQEVTQLDIFDEVEALGTLQARENVNLTTTITERLVKINFKDNQAVSKGDILVEMEASEEKALLKEEQAKNTEANLQVARLRKLVKANASAQRILDEKIRDLHTSNARIKALQARINERQIIAPFDGVVGIRNISVGALVEPGTLITTLDDIREMKLDFSVPEIFLKTLKKGVEVLASTDAYPSRTFTGKVVSVDSRVDSETRSVMARAVLDNADKTLKAGMLIKVQLKKNPRKSIVIKEEALITRGQKHFVYILESPDTRQKTGTASLKEVKIGRRQEGTVEISNGLVVGQLIITHGSLKIHPNTTVQYKIKQS